MEEKVRNKTRKQTAVSVVKSNQGVVLLEWVEDGKVHRGYLPIDLVQDGVVYNEDLDSASPHGIAWESLIKPSATSAKIGDSLRKAGIWTAQDLQRYPRAAIGALQAAYGVDVAELNRIAQNQTNNKEEV